MGIEIKPAGQMPEDGYYVVSPDMANHWLANWNYVRINRHGQRARSSWRWSQRNAGATLPRCVLLT